MRREDSELRAPTTVRIAVAVRPLRPITLPMSSGWTCTSRVRPRRLPHRHQLSAVGEPQIGVVRPDDHPDLTLDPMRPADPPDCHQHLHKPFSGDQLREDIN